MEIFSLLVGLLCMYFLQNYLYRRYWDKNLTVSFTFSKHRVAEGETVHLEETIVNKKWLPLPVVTIKFKTSKYFAFEDADTSQISDYYNRSDLFSLLMYQKLTRTLSFVCKKRGYFSMNLSSLICSNLFLTEDYPKELDSADSLVVYPRCVDISRFEVTFESLFGSILSKRYIHEDPFEFRGIREYQTYDTMNTINWKASAKTGALMVNQKDYTAQQKISIFLNLTQENLIKDEELFEESIRLAKTFCTRFITQGMNVALYTNGLHFEHKTPVFVDYYGTQKQLLRVDEALATVAVRYELPDFYELYHRELDACNANDFCICISSYQREDWQQLMRRLRKKGSTLSWVIPCSEKVTYHPEHDISSYCIPWNIS